MSNKLQAEREGEAILSAELKKKIADKALEYFTSHIEISKIVNPDLMDESEELDEKELEKLLYQALDQIRLTPNMS